MGREAIEPKRYVLLGGDCYYPQGGFYDLKESSNSPEELLDSEHLKGPGLEWWEIVDLVTFEVIHTDLKGGTRDN